MHFRDYGFRDVAIIQHPFSPEVRRLRFEGFCQAAKNLGLSVHCYDPVLSDGTRTSEEHCIAWLRAKPKPLGIFFHQDADASFFLSECQEHGLEIGSDIGVLGVDDLAICAGTQPPLSSIAFAWISIGEQVARCLHSLISGSESKPTSLPLAPFRVKIRASTSGRKPTDPVVTMMAKALAKNPSDRRSLDDWAVITGISRSNLHRRFINDLGIAPIQYRMRVRLQHAQKLLLSSSDSICDIATACGFASLRCFESAFAAVSPLPPSAFRRHGKE